MKGILDCPVQPMGLSVRQLLVRVAGVEGQALEPADWGGGGGSLYTRDAILDPGDMPGLDNQCSVCPEKVKICGINMVKLLLLSSTHG